MGELVFNGALFLMFIGMTFYSGQIKIWEGFFGARYWPMMLTIIASLIFAFKTYRIYKELPAEKRKVKFDLSILKDKPTQKLLLSFVWVIFYTILLDYCGFFVSTIIFGMGLSWLLGLKSIGKLFLANFCVTTVIYSVFAWGLSIMLPRGVGFFYYFSYWLETLL